MVFGLFGGQKYVPERDMPDLTGKVIVVTGGNTGLGYQSIALFAQKGAKVFMASRTEKKALDAIETIKNVDPKADVNFLPLDLTSFASIRRFSTLLTSATPHVDILLNNAGVMALPMDHTSEGHEIQFGTNHLGHFFLTRLLTPHLLRAPSPRFVNVSSAGHNLAFRGIPELPADFTASTLAKNLEQRITWERYGISKLSNLLHARELAKREPRITAVSCHPGVIISNLYNAFAASSFLTGPMVRVASYVTTGAKEGAWNQVWCATQSDVVDGAYYVPVGRVPGGLLDIRVSESRWGKKDGEAERLWEWSEGVCAKWEKENPIEGETA